MRILLVDDNSTDIERSLEALDAHGLARFVRVARGGQEALDFLFGRGQFQDRRRHPLPDIVLLDMNMPRVDGFCVLWQIRRSDALRRIPVIALCCSGEEALRAVAYRAHADDCLLKPLSGGEELRDSIDRALAGQPHQDVDLLLHRECIPGVARGGAGRG